MVSDSELRDLIRAVDGFPRPGIVFRDITPLLHDATAYRDVTSRLADVARSWDATVVSGIEARGFLFGGPVAQLLELPFVPIRKPGKLPAAHVTVSYALEYGTDSLQLHADPPLGGHRVVLIDDLLATGGTARAAGRLVREVGGELAGYAFLIELDELGGRAELTEPVHSLLHY